MSALSDAWAQTTGTVEQRQAQLRALTVEVDIPIPARAVKRLWGQRMVLAAAKFAAENSALAQPLRVLCLATYDNLMADLFNDLDPSDPTQSATITAFLDGLQAAGVLTNEVRAETLALGKMQRPLFTESEIDFPALRAEGLITAAEAGLAED